MVPQLWRDLSPDAAVAATATAMGSAAYAWLSQSQYRSFRRCDAVPAVCVYRDRLECLARRRQRAWAWASPVTPQPCSVNRPVATVWKCSNSGACNPRNDDNGNIFFNSVVVPGGGHTHTSSSNNSNIGSSSTSCFAAVST
ncbi:GD19529 [Drosophila simulans]|uniref:GD19529 n=1 Tax=Drosophila simulans TaxID=7240 RepID=B4NVG9_DROSI|nr:GD19529 [Drosophila simulans]